jgi:predicted MPP superfamily phosphohydrolase
MKTLRFLFTILAICFLAACTKDLPTEDMSQVPSNGSNELKSKPLQLKIAVLSDIHYMDPSLLMNGAENGLAFQTYLAYDPKLIQFSDPIFRTALSKIVREKPDIVLIPGDLTKDGEPVSHESVAALLHQLADDGIKV